MEKYRKYRVILAFVSLICIIYIYYLKINDEIQIEITQNNSHIHILDQGLKNVFYERRQILKRGCVYINKLRQIQGKESYETLLYYHNILQNLTVSQNELEKIFEEKEEGDIEIGSSGFIRVVNKPYNILYCAAPKCGTTNWQLGMQVLVDSSNGIYNQSPETYVPTEVFHQRQYHASDFESNSGPVLSGKVYKAQNYSKIIVTRNPFDRLYSAWNDKSRTFRFSNGSIDYEQIKKSTTWLWGLESLSETSKRKKINSKLTG